MYIDLRLGLCIAVLAALFSATMWWIFVRPVPERSATGRVTEVVLRPAERVERNVPQFARSLERMNREVRYDLPERALLSIELEDGASVRFETPLATPSAKLAPGARVRVVYQQRGLPLLWSRRYVTQVSPDGE